MNANRCCYYYYHIAVGVHTHQTVNGLLQIDLIHYTAVYFATINVTTLVK